MPIEEMLKEIEAENQKIAESTRKIKELSEKIMSNKSLGVEWVTVKKASQFLDVSLAFVYGKINRGDLQCKHLGSKKYVLLEELKKLDDKYNY